MKKYWILYAIISIVLSSCNRDRSNREVIPNAASYDYELASNGKILSYTLDDDTKYSFSSLFTYTDKSGKEYLTFLNIAFFEILFYDLNNTDFLFKIKLEREGPNGIPGPGGFHIIDFDNIYVTCSMTPFLYKIDTTGVLTQKIRYGLTESGYQIIPYDSWSFSYTPLVFIDSKLYLPQRPWQGNPISKTPLCVVIDTLNQQNYALPCPFPQLIKDNEYSHVMSDVISFSRIFNGKQFVYSFFGDEDIYVIPVDHQEVFKYKAKSKYINRIKIETRSFDNPYASAKYRYGAPFYGNLIHDPYRNLYYRFAHPEVELEDGPDYMSLTVHGRKKFSIIILDENYNVIGETLFPEWVYCPTVLFVHRDGLYICNNHPMNPSFNEDMLSFECFEVKKVNH